MGIRKRVTLDEDLAERVQHESRMRGMSFSETLNDLLRHQLPSVERPFRRTVRIEPIAMGRNPALNYDDVAGLLDYSEGDSRR